jgi:hypothetical protein
VAAHLAYDREGDTVSTRTAPTEGMSPHLTPRGFWEYVHERVRIRDARRAGQPPPWTDDPLLSSLHFPNVHREDDLGTVYFHEQTASCTPGEVLWYAYAYRLLNRIETFERHGGLRTAAPRRRSLDRWYVALEKDLAAGIPVSTGRHFVPGFQRYVELTGYVLEHRRELERAVLAAETLEAACAAVRTVPHVGTFFSWQITCDLLEARVVPFDEDDWAEFGPGASNALHMMESGVSCADYVWGQPPSPRRVAELRPYADWLVASQEGFLPAGFGGPRVTLKNAEHGLCEYLRYVRAGAGFYAKGGKRSWS